MSTEPLDNPLDVPSLHKQFMDVTQQRKLASGDRIMDLVSAGFEDCALDRMVATTGDVMVPIHRLESLAIQVHSERKLSQFLGVALREVLPMASRDLDMLTFEADNSHRYKTPAEVEGMATDGKKAVVRAQAALAALHSTVLFVDNTPAHAFDDEFHIRFED